MEKVGESVRAARDSLLSVLPSWWPVFFWLFIGQLIWETVMVVLDAGIALSGMGLIERVRFVRSELADDVVISAAVSMILVDLGRYLLLTSGWLKNLIDRNISNYEKRVRAEGRVEGRNEGRAEVLHVLDEDTRKDAEQKLRRNGDSETQD